jgi:hypothetical protein
VWRSLAPSFLEEGPIDSNELGKRHLGGGGGGRGRSLENENNVVNKPVVNFPLDASSHYKMKVIFSRLLFS